MTSFALVPARGGSKGVIKKNIRDLAGKPLIAYSIEQALQAEQVDKVVVSSDSDEILDISSSYGAEILERPAELAEDESSIDGVISHFIQSKRLCPGDEIVLLQPTSPLRKAADIDACLSLLRSSGDVRCVISVYEPGTSIIKGYYERGDGSISGIYSEAAPNERRQDLPRAYMPNGAIYGFSVAEFQKEARIPKKGVYPYVMPEAQSIDIDTDRDLKVAEQSLSRGEK
ncbi:MAG: cytidylyltransferase domain-containing protein [Pseudomonadota bacterium]